MYWRYKVLVASLAIGAVTSVIAQEQAVKGDAAAGIQEVVVTGSRIAAPNLESSSPIQVVTAKDIQTSGKTDISDIIMQLPQNFDNGLGQDLGNRTSGLTTAGGVATADLRGLGPNRTLVLVDGIRLGIGTPFTFVQQPAPDLDQIPTFLVDRIEVVTGGASATYGSDAIAGVINFIMKKNFEGIQFDGQFGADWHKNHDDYWQQAVRDFGTTPPTGTSWDGKNKNFDIVAGMNSPDGKGNVTGYMSYFQTDPVSGAQRDWSACQATEIFDDAGVNVVGQGCGGSSNSNSFKLIDPVRNPNGKNVYSVFGTSFVPRGSVATTPPGTFNSQPYIYMTRQDTRYTAGFMAHYEVSPYFQPYADFYFTDDQTHQAIAPTALFKSSNPNDPNGAGNYYTNCSNPLLSAQQAGILCTPAQIANDVANPGSQLAQLEIGRRNVEGGGRSSDFNHSSYRMLAGSKAEIADGWTYDAYGQYYYVTFFNSNNKYMNYANIDQALLVTGTKANPKCINQGGGCVPYNIWSDGGVTPEQLNYLTLSGTGSGNYTMRTLHGEITGDLGRYGVKFPTAHDGLAVNFGVEHRTQQQVFAPDAAELGGQLAGFGSAATPLNVGDNVTEEWIELRAPLVSDKPGVKDLVFDTAYRHSDYSIAGGVNTYKFELQYAPTRDIRFRGTYDRAIRAPALIELFNPNLVGLIQFGNDPCAPTTDKAGNPVAAKASLAQCQAQGATAAQYGNGFGIPQPSSGQLSQLTGGNLKLKPETSRSYTVGFTVTPELVPGLTGSLDYFHIAIEQLVSTVPASVIMSKCLADLASSYCNYIVRNTATGSLGGATIAGGGYFLQTNVNVGAALVSGIDLQLNYKHSLSQMGSIGFAMNGSYLDHSKATPLPDEHTYDCAGLFGLTCQTVNPRWRHIFRTTWVTPWNVDASLTWRYTGTVSQDNNTSDPTLHGAAYGGGYSNSPSKIGSYSYLDLAASWHVLTNLELRAGINNLADKDPPVVPVAIQPGGSNAYSAYDQLGRQVFLAFTAKF